MSQNIWFSQGLCSPASLAVEGGKLYISNYCTNKITQVNLNNNSIYNSNWAPSGASITNPSGLAIVGGYLYISNGSINTISKVSLSNPSGDFISNWASSLSLSSPTGLAVSGNYLYIANYTNSTISKVSLSNPSIDYTLDWAPIGASINGPYGLAISSGYLYIANQGTNKISQVSLSNPSGDFNSNWASSLSLNGPSGLAVYGNYLYITNYIDNTVSKISLINPLIDYSINIFPCNAGLVTPYAIVIVDNYFYIANVSDNTISRISLTVNPCSNICFPAGTPVMTDQGIVNIEQLIEGKHTIDRQSILHITKTVTLDKYLISFKPNSIRRNIPTQTTIMTKDHKIDFDGKMVPAQRFLDYSKEIKKVKYSGEVLYNVLLQQHSKMIINNLVCETLHPENIIAKLYSNNYSEEEKNSIVFEMNESLTKRDLLKYKSVLGKVQQNATMIER